ncbi:alpha/beta fold hydrolase [Dyella monticola]|uniref:Alpha/beta fold hydrolase n=1 Tax=Dyella monticola TaxID=1927958 RepID=A0A370WUJ2_9GAMM|nr:alpha/beta fold hydrolase [Dyella monticola]RDS79808.1 alpha/beta fold hydrolase [Dyella monticola]
MLASLMLALASSVALHAIPVNTIYIDMPGAPKQHLALHCARPAQASRTSVLFIHGASFPTMLASGFEFAPGDSWLEYMARKGYVACGLDFLGFGASSRPPAMMGPAHAAAPVTDANEAANEIALAVDALRKKQGMTAVHIVAHSWGTVAAAAFAARHPDALSSLTLFGPIVPVKATADTTPQAAWWPLTAQQRLEQLRFKDVLPPDQHLLEPAVDNTWAPSFAASVPHVAGDKPETLRIPYGPLADIDAVSAGQYPYDARDVIVPVFVVYGNYDDVVNDAGATSFLQRFTASPLKWRLRIDDGTHVMHLERNRYSLYESVNAFIHAAEDMAP